MNYTSNTKLTPEQKLELANMQAHAELHDIETAFLDNVTTMAFKDCGSTVHFSLAIKSEDEKKFRSNVGEYHALEKFMAGQYVAMQRDDFNIMLDTIWNLQLD